MVKKIVIAALLATSIPAPAAAAKPARTWWCSPSGTSHLTPLFRLLGGNSYLC
jgi:hypothetical protein